MKLFSIILAVLSLCCFCNTADAYQCSHSNKKHHAAKTTLASPAEDNYDIKYLNFHLNLTDTSVYVDGNVATTAQVVVSSMSDYVFELDTTLTIDSAFINGELLPVSHSGIVQTIHLPTPLSTGNIFTAEIYYHGMPPGGGGGFFNGITHATTSGGSHVVFTISDPYVALNWWPCKQSVLDKIDSVDMYIKVPAGVVDGSNGVLVNVDSTTTPGFWEYHWKTNYNIAYYLISIAVAKYGQYQSYCHLTPGSDSVLIHNFFLDTATFNPLYKANFDSLDQMLNFFSSLYGKYPFWKEKYGVCYTTLPGGMEHQTMTTIGVPNTSTIAHELAHQWFGDNVTYKTWGDMWLSEGFATYSEPLFLEHFWGAAAAKAKRAAHQSATMSNPCGMLYVNDTTNSDSLFNGTTVYAKGSAIVRMLQYAAPSDSVFFTMLRDYQNTYKLGNASTADLKAIAESYYGHSLDTFFNQWIYGRGFPRYKTRWNQIGNTVYVKLIQMPSCPSYTPHFSTYIELQLKSGTADTFVKIYNNADSQVFSFTWDRSMTGITLNPNYWTLCTTFGTVVKDNTLAVNSQPLVKYNIYPNPTENNWTIELNTPEKTLQLFDIKGSLLWEGISTKSPTTIPATKLPPGTYLLLVDRKDSIQLKKE